MDYNKDGKGFVCFMYRLTQNRILYVSFAFIIATLGLFLNLKFFQESDSFQYLMFGFLSLVLFSIFISINPKIFILKLIGFLGCLGSILVILHNLSKLDKQSIFGIYFTIMSVVGLLVVVTLLSWFVYNARSSE